MIDRFNMLRLSILLMVLTLPACHAQTPWRSKRNVPLVQDNPDVPFRDGGKTTMPRSQQATLIRQDPLWRRAIGLHYDAFVMDGHIDVPTLMVSDPNYQFRRRHKTPPHVDLPRMVEGGLDAAFFSIYVGSEYPEGRESINRAKEEIFYLRRQLEGLEDSVRIVTSAADLRNVTSTGKKAILLGIEGGHAIANADFEVLRHFHNEGVRYITLSHVNTNSFADASQSPPKWGGLNEAGRNLVQEMNRLGILVDLSHVADSTFWDALAVSKSPMIASHSSARALTENVRNMTDDMIRALGQRGGVVMVNFMESVVNRQMTKAVMEEVYERLRNDYNNNYYMMWQVISMVQREKGLRPGNLDDVIAHIIHIARIAGVDHVGLGSDFDGATMPDGLEDVTKLPYITYKLLKAGFSEVEVRKILGGNSLRVLAEAERIAASLKGAP
ncbi:MAG: dipeptidase [Bacteroidetes Order II. Incertae sedis bacterium]|nr:dipeptidase [Bacteroidetes Order II. bacterium]